MNVLQAIVLGVLQGLTEFLPISSSAHLVIIRWAFGWECNDVAFDVALHFGTLIALVLYFWRDWFDMVGTYLRSTKTRPVVGKSMSVQNTGRFFLWPVVLACVPAGLAGALLEHQVESTFRQQPYLVGTALIALGILLYLGARLGKNSRPLDGVMARDWIIVGLAQALAIVPGVSRSGITITAGLFTGLKRDAAAQFSFLLGAPVILGAAVFELPDAVRVGLADGNMLSLVAGMAASVLVGYLCIGFLMRYLRERGVGLFVWYRVLLGLAVFAAHALGFLRV